MPTPIDARHTADLDSPFPTFSLTSNGRVYTIEIERLHSQHLYHGVLEWDPWTRGLRDDSRSTTGRSWTRPSGSRRTSRSFGPGGSRPPCSRPRRTRRDPEFQNGSRWQGHLWAATLCSLDDFFPIPFRGGGAPQPADYSEADVLYATRLGEGPLPQRIQDAIDWERVARPQMF